MEEGRLGGRGMGAVLVRKVDGGASLDGGEEA